jgi:hypothetical protein
VRVRRPHVRQEVAIPLHHEYNPSCRQRIGMIWTLPVYVDNQNRMPSENNSGHGQPQHGPLA